MNNNIYKYRNKLYVKNKISVCTYYFLTCVNMNHSSSEVCYTVYIVVCSVISVVLHNYIIIIILFYIIIQVLLLLFRDDKFQI
jgi:hypothetical protein